MKEIIVKKNEAGQRLDKLLFKILNKAPKSFVYKMLRKKNIVLNDKKAQGFEIIKFKDIIKIYISDDTYNKFSIDIDIKTYDYKPDIIYEDNHIIIVNKPLGFLSQKSSTNDISINEYIISYLLESNSISKEEMLTFKPSICNRLDRNTSGIIIAGKTLLGLQEVSKLLRDREIDKYYLTIVKGKLFGNRKIHNWILKDNDKNKVKVINNQTENAYEIITEYAPISYSKVNIDNKDIDLTLLRVKLITGRTHQIRAHLSYLNNPIIGDDKYGDMEINKYFKNKFKLNYQFLHCNEIKFGEINSELSYLSNKIFTANMPEVYKDICKMIHI